MVGQFFDLRVRPVITVLASAGTHYYNLSSCWCHLVRTVRGCTGPTFAVIWQR